jgi:hypothetical protein
MNEEGILQEPSGNDILPYVSKNKFIEEFIDSVGGRMYKYRDPYDYSCGMEQLEDSEIKKIGNDLYDSLYSC